MSSTNPRISRASIFDATNYETGEVTYEDEGVLRGYSYADEIFGDVILHFDGVSMICTEQVLNTCSIFKAAFDSCTKSNKYKEYTIEKYSRRAVMVILNHLYEEDGWVHLARFYRNLDAEFMSVAAPDLPEHLEVYRMADEHGLPELRARYQGIIMAFSRRAMELKDTLHTSLVLEQVLDTYDKNPELKLDLGVLQDFLAQCLEYECIEKIGGVWITKDERYKTFVKKLNDACEKRLRREKATKQRSVEVSC